MISALRIFCLVCALGFSAALHAADGAASRSSTADAVARAAASARSTMGGSNGSFFFGAVPGTLLTDPLQISTSFATPIAVDYGDGTQVTYNPGETPSHTYASAGTYQVKAVIGSTELTTVTLNFAVPFNSSVPNVYGMGVLTDLTDAKAIDIQYVFNGAATGTLDFGDGSPTTSVDSGTTSAPGHTYADGFYNASLLVTGTGTQTGSVSFNAPLTSGKSPEIAISGISVGPNPCNVGDTVTFAGTITAKGVSGDLSGSLDFGDGSAPFTVSGTLSGSLKEGVTHSYAANGVYTAVLTVTGTGASATTKVFVIVGRGTVVNSTNGAFETQNATGSSVTLTLNGGSSLTGVVDASTTFDDTLPRAAPVAGLIPGRSFATPTISVATSNLLDASAVVKGKTRKTIAIGARASGDSSGLADPASTDIKLKKMSGKFLFTKTTSDQVSFSGTFQLPPGFDPAKTGGNSVSVAIGNIVDTVLVDAKGKPIDKSTGLNQRIKKLSVKYPKLTGATAVGGEIAQFDVTLVLPDMDVAGMDTEGITASLRSDEKKLKAAPRFIQVNLLLSGVAYETYVPVQYKVSKKGDAGQLQGRGSK